MSEAHNGSVFSAQNTIGISRLRCQYTPGSIRNLTDMHRSDSSEPNASRTSLASLGALASLHPVPLEPAQHRPHHALCLGTVQAVVVWGGEKGGIRTARLGEKE